MSKQGGEKSECLREHEREKRERGGDLGREKSEREREKARRRKE